MKKLIYTIILCLFLAIGCIDNVNAYDKNVKKVLFISSYNPNYITFNDQINGLKETLGKDIIFQIEYMDFKTIEDSDAKDKLYELLKSKMDNYNKFDAVVLADDGALSFGLEHKDMLFKDTPIVFLGVSNLDLINKAISLNNVYGIEENPSMEENITLIGNLHKNKNLVLLIDQPEKSSAQLEEFYNLEKNFKNLKFSHLSMVDTDEKDFKKELNKLDKNDVVLTMYTYNNRQGQTDVIHDELNFILKNTSVPVYCSYDFSMNNKFLEENIFIGGKVISNYNQGTEAGKIVCDILNNKIPPKKLIKKEDVNNYMFNNTGLKLNNIRKHNLPKGSVIMNDLKNFILEYKSIALNIAIVILCLIITILVFFSYTLERLKYEKKLIKAKEIAESSNEAKNHFISNMSHEFRTPLTLILSANSLLEKNHENSKNELSIVDKTNTHIIKQNCYRLIRLTNNIIDITKADSNFMDLKLSNVNIIYILESIVESTMSYAKSKDISIIFDTQEEELMMAVDVDKIERIVLNLISNAIKFSNCDGSIFIDVKVNNNMLVFSVEDTGIGIEPHYIDKIFDKFTQVDTTTFRKNEGSGIGLSLVKFFVNAHGGIIYVESTVNVGSKFTIELPIKLVDSEQSSEINYESSVVTSTNIEFSDIYF